MNPATIASWAQGGHLHHVPLLGYEVDFLWLAGRLVVEADGGDHLDPTQRDVDNDRDIARGRAGYLVRRYSSRAMDDETSLAAEVLSILAERLPRMDTRQFDVHFNKETS